MDTTPTLIDLQAGETVAIRGDKYILTKTTMLEGEVIPKPEKTQKTYMQKATCPVCKRVIRVTSKNWASTDVRANIACMHNDGNAYNFVLDNPEEAE